MFHKKEHQKKNSSEEKEQLQLFLQVGSSSFNYTIYISDSNQVLESRHFDFERSYAPNTFEHLNAVRSLTSDIPTLKSSFGKVCLSHLNNRITPVPKKFFCEQKCREYLKHTARIDEDEAIAFDEIEEASILNVYIPFSNISEYFKGIYPDLKSIHSATFLHNQIIKNHQHTTKQELFVNFHRHSFEILAFSKDKFVLYNHFDKKTPEDYIYHILFVAQQLNFDPESFKMMLVGQVHSSSEFYNVSLQYVQDVSIANSLLSYL